MCSIHFAHLRTVRRSSRSLRPISSRLHLQGGGGLTPHCIYLAFRRNAISVTPDKRNEEECSLGYGATRDKKRLEETRLLTDVRYLSLSKDTQPKALQLFYESQTCADLHDKSTGLYLYGDLYVADEFMREKGEEEG